jgi:hypothetical protein
MLYIGLSSGNVVALTEIPSELLALVLQFFSYGLSPVVLRDIRQICLFTYKIKSHEVTKTQMDQASLGFRARNSTCQGLSSSHYQHLAGKAEDKGQTLRVARLLCGIVTCNIDWREINPSHGPGAVADARRSGASKWKTLDGACCRITDKMYPISEFFTPSPSLYKYEEARFVDPVCKFSVVPKDRRGPRVICTQPTGLMWIQQGQRRVLERCIETSRILKTNRYCVTDGIATSIKFDRQENNGSLALESSRTREFATIDLKDASDLVSWGLVRFLFNRETVRFLAASRPTHVKILKDKPERLHMYAPMGSAMCFPIESLVFWALATAACLVSRGVTYEEVVRFHAASKWLQNNLSEVFVFGDDILVRTEACQVVCERLSELGLVPNLQKTFHRGFYREACGVDAFHGERLDVVRLKSLTLTSMPDAYAFIDVSKRARRAGMFQLANYLETEVESYLGFKLAAGLNSGGALWDRGWTYDQDGARKALSWNLRRNIGIRFNTRYQYFEARTIIASPLTFHEPQDGRYRLFRGLTTGVDEHTVDWLNPDNTQYHLGWVKAF